MTEHAEPDQELVAARVEAARAAIASGLAARAGLSFAGPGPAAPNQQQQLTLSPYWPLGYELASELMVLEWVTQPTAPDATPAPAALTSADLLVSETAAFLFDKLINPVLPLQRVAPEVGDLVPLNAVYDEVLRRARFAGSIRATSAAYDEAAAQLYVQDATGVRTETTAYRDYLEFERQAREAQNAVDVAAADDVERAAEQRDRVLADWLLRGHRRKIDAAIQVILTEEAASGFEDERGQLIGRLKAGRRARVDASGFAYFPARLLPIGPLLDSTAEASGWTTVEIGPADLRDLLTGEELRGTFTAETVEHVLEGFRKLSFEFVVCDVVRDWLDEDFFAQRFWRLAAGELLSDGAGGGRLPGFASSLVFLRGAAVEYVGPLTAQFDSGPVSPPRIPLHTIRILGEERRPRVLDPARSLAAARALDLPLTVAMLAPVAPRPAVRPPTMVLTQSLRAAVTARLRLPLGAGPPVTVRDHRNPIPLKLPDRVVRVRVTITSNGEALDGMTVEVVPLDQVIRRPVLTGDGDSVSAVVDVPASIGGRAAALVVRVMDRGQTLDQQTLAIGSTPLEVHWSVAAESLSIELTAAAVPTLFGHVVRALPRCPDPDEALTWE